MNDNFTERLLEAKSRDAFLTLIETYDLSVESIRQLKSLSEKHYRCDPNEALQIAYKAREFGCYISPLAEAIGQWAVANALVFTQKYADAEQNFEEARKALLEHSGKLEIARMNVGLVGVKAYLGKIDEALIIAKESQHVLSTQGTTNDDKRRLISIMVNTGVAFELQGKYEESIETYQHAIQVASSLEQIDRRAMLHNNMALAYGELNRIQDALDSLDTAEHLFQQQNATIELLRLNMNRALLLIKANHFQQARQALAQARNHLRDSCKNDSVLHRIALYEALIETKYQNKISSSTFSNLDEARKFYATNGPLTEHGLALLFLGECHLADQNLEKAVQAFRESYFIAEKNVERFLKHSAAFSLAQVLWQQGYASQAIELYEEAISEIDLTRKYIHADLHRASFFADKLSIYQGLTEVYLSSDDLHSVFLTIERARARLISERLIVRTQNHRIANKSNVQDSIFDEVTDLNTNIEHLNKLYNQAAIQNVGEINSADITLSSSIMDLEQTISRQISSVQVKQKIFSPLAIGDVAHLNQVQSHLNDENLLYYFLLHDEMWVLMLNAEEEVVYQCCGTVAEINLLVKNFYQALERTLGLVSQLGISDVAPFVIPLLEDVNTQLHQLYLLLLEPAIEHLEEHQNIIISVEAILSHVPFHALFDGTSYLVEKYAVGYVPSGTVLDLCFQKAASSKTSLLMGYAADDLPQISKEIREIMDLTSNPTVYLDSDATVERFVDEADKYGHIHISAHAQFRTDKSMLSSLRFADRNLFLSELSQLDLNADFVVLSGCETGRGETSGSDLLSLSAAIFGAGARSLLVSLWRVEDVITTRYMKFFYTRLCGGDSKIEALRQAQLEILSLGRSQPDLSIYQHPAFWAPFTLLGNWHPLQITESKSVSVAKSPT